MRRTGTVLALMVLAGFLGACASGRYAEPPKPTESDRAVLANVTQQVLEDKPTGESSNWVNEETGHRGTVTPFDTYEKDGRPCRRYQQTVTIEGTTLVAFGTACRDDSSQWTTTKYTGLATARTYRDRRYAHPYYGYPRYHRRYYPYHRYPYWYHRPYYRYHLGFGYRHYY